MKSKIYAVTIDSRLTTVIVEAETEEQICQKAFEMEVESKYTNLILAIRFSEGQKAMTWDTTYANYCFGKGRIVFDQFKKVCTSRNHTATA